MIFKGAFAPDDKICAGDFLSYRHLRGDTLFDLELRPAATRKAPASGIFRAGHANNFVETRRGASFVEERNYDDSDGRVSALPGFDLRKPAFPNPGMENRFELLPGNCIPEDKTGEFITAQLSIRGDNFIAESSLNFTESRLAGLDEFASEMVSIDYSNAALLEKRGGSGFSHAHTAGQSEQFHFIYCTRAR
jgi:hypothetical protein